jgi:peptide/nickel transport system ATP-binding protein
MIGLHGVTVLYGTGERRIRAAGDIAFEVAEGEAFGLAGESGSGKSTVLRAVAGLVPHATGRIVLAGQDMPRHRTRAMRRLAQMVFQDPYGSLHPNQTVDQALTAPLRIHRIADAESRVTAALREVGLGPEHRFRFPHQLSGGQRQRVAIARALMLRPRILLLDEPTSALDVSVQAEILNMLTRLRREFGLTLLMVSHDLAVLAHVCERIGIMRQGSLLEIATAQALADGDVADPYTRELLRSNLDLTGAAHMQETAEA